MKKRVLCSILSFCIIFGIIPVMPISAVTDNEYVYLSDMEYFPSSKAGYGSIQKDKNIEGGTITVNLDGVATPFERGMGAHATSTLYYDLSEYTEYTRFSAYMGIDASKNSGNGVGFTISVSEDMQEWTQIYSVDKILPGQDAVYVDINLNSAKYLKLYSDSLGNNTQDHSVYADARLLTASYDTEAENFAKFKKVSVYDEQIMNEYNELEAGAELTENMKRDLLLRTFTKRYGYYTIQKKARESENAKNAINYIYDNSKVLNYFVLGGVKDRSNGVYANSLDAWCSLYEKYNEDFDANAETGTDGDMYLKLAVSLSIAYARSLNFWIGSVRNSVPVERYGEFKYLIENGYFDMVNGWSRKQFASLPIELMRLAVNTEIHEDEFVWLADWSKKKGGEYPTLNAYDFITYTSLPDYNYGSGAFPQYYDVTQIENYREKWNLNDIYLRNQSDGENTPLVELGTDKHPRLWMMFDAGSVCGGLAGTFEVLNEVHGIPAELINQPGHAATFVYSESEDGKGIWSIKNDVSNWKKSKDYNTFYPLGWKAKNNGSEDYVYDGSFILLAQRAFNEYNKLEKAMYYKYLADIYAEENNRLSDIYKKQLEIQPYNWDALTGILNLYLNDDSTTTNQYMEFASYVVEQLTYYPLPMLDILKSIEPKITEDTVTKLKFDSIRKNALEKAAAATAEESIQYAAVKDVAQMYLGQENEPFTFSFDGENAGKIMLNESYAGNDVAWCYTLGGVDLLDEALNPEKDGVVTVQSSEKQLTSEELDLLSAENDICIYMVGANSNIYTIDITEGTTPTSKTLYGNDWENRFVGAIDNLQWRESEKDVWNDYTENTVFEGDRTVYVRYKPYKTMLSGETAEYNFTADTDSASRKYIPIMSISLDSYSSQQSSSDGAIHLIDGNLNTRWHNSWSGETNLYYSVEFDKERYITEIEYYPDESGWNGQFKSGEIYITTDECDEWVLADSFSDLEKTKTAKTISLQKPVKCKKLKIVLKETYGQTESQCNRFACGRMLNFYEDTTVIPTSTAIPTSAPTSTPTVIPTSTPITVPVDKITVKAENNKLKIALNIDNDSNDVIVYIAFKNEGKLMKVEKPVIYGMNTEVDLSEVEYKDIEIYVWDKNQKPYIPVTKLESSDLNF